MKRSFFILNRLLVPESVPERVVFAGSILSVALIAFADIFSGTLVRLFYLYTFPLVAVGLHCQRPSFRFTVWASVLASEMLVQSNLNIPMMLIVGHLIFKGVASATIVLGANTVRILYLRTLELATTDGLTKLMNRRAFESILNFEIARKKRYGEMFSMALLDLDGFKELNDSMGHKVGDNALRLVADVFRDNTRESDVIARLGGDEFVILMPNTSTMDCRATCNRLCTSVANRMKEARFSLTVSIGAITFKTSPSSAENAIVQADTAMYEAKKNGKNGVVCHQS